MAEGRERWAGRLPFIMAAVGSAVGLGNIWRFPKVVYESNGGTFLIPYFIALITAGIPLMIVEYALGQKYQGGAPQAMAAVTKKFKWVGWFALLVGTVITFYYISIMAWSFHYTVNSFGPGWAKPYDQVAYTIDTENNCIIDDTKNTVEAKDIVIYYLYEDDAAKKRVENQLKGYEHIKLVSQQELDNLKTTFPDKTYVPFEDNVGGYLLKDTLGLHTEPWAAAQAHNNTVDEQVKRIRETAKDNKRSINDSEKNQINKLNETKISYLAHMLAPQWKLFLGALLTWLAIFFIIFKGVKNVGKIVMFTVPLPIIIILIIAIKGLFLEGAMDGLAYYLTPSWDKLFDPAIWIAAYGQIFFSLSLGFGILIAYASYMPEDSDITNNAFLTSFANCSTSFLGGFAVFSVLGYLAHIKGLPVDKVASSSIGLAFITYPTAITLMGKFTGMIIGFIFFICLLSLGIDSAFSILEGVITGVKDNFPKTSKAFLTGLFCVVGFFVTSFIFCARSGLMWLDIADNWMNNYGLPLVGLFECIAIGYFGDLDELKAFINKHSEIKLHYWFDAFIKVITPAILIYLLSHQLIGDLQNVYGDYDKVLSWSVNVAGWGLFGFMIILATIFGKNFHLLAWELSSGAVFLILYGIYSLTSLENPGTIAAMTTLGSMLLFGGFFHCLYIAMTEKLPAGSAAAEPEVNDEPEAPEEEAPETETAGE